MFLPDHKEWVASVMIIQDGLEREGGWICLQGGKQVTYKSDIGYSDIKEKVAWYVLNADNKSPRTKTYSDINENVVGYVFKAERKLHTTKTYSDIKRR